MANVTWADFISIVSNAIVYFAEVECDNVGKTGSAPSEYNASRGKQLTYSVMSKERGETTSPDGHSAQVNFYDSGGEGTLNGGTISYTISGIDGFPSGLTTSVSTETVSNEFLTYIQRYAPATPTKTLTQTRLSALIMQALMFIANKFVAYVAGSKKIYYKSDAYVGSAYVGTNVGFFDSESFINNTTTLTAVQDALKNVTNLATVTWLPSATSSATSSTSSCSSSSSTSSSCSSSSCSSSSSSSCSSTSCCSSSCSCYFIAFYDIGVM